jgi:hypothetical protein
MNFQELLSKMVELDQPVPEATIQQEAPVLDEPATDITPVAEEPVEECPTDMAPPSPEGHDDGPKPTVSINLNAQGIDDIAELMKLVAKVNPGMEKPAIAPIAAPTLDRPELPPLKMLPEPDEKDGEEDGEADKDKTENPLLARAAMAAMGAKALGGDDQEEAYANEPDEETKSVDYMNNKLAGGMNKPKQMVKRSYKQGDNPMAMPEGDLRAAIRAELLQRLAEAKGAK